MVSKRTILLSLAASGIALVVWLAVGALHVLLEHAGVPAGLQGFVAPATPAVLLVWHAPDTALVAGIALAVVVAVLAAPSVHASGTGFAPRVLGVWFAVVVGGAVACGFSGWPTILGMLQYGTDGLTQAALLGMFEPVRRGTAWGATYGWVVGLAVVAIARRLEGGEPTARRAGGALPAALVVGAVAAAGWSLAAVAHGWVDRTVAEYVTTARSALAGTVSTAADWLAPVTTAGDASLGAVLACAGLVGTVAGGLTYVAARSTVLPAGRTVLVLAVWVACVAGALLGAIPTALVGVGLDPQGDGRYLAQSLLKSGPTDGGAAGLLYGWIPAVLALLVLRRPAEPDADDLAGGDAGPATTPLDVTV